MTQTCVPHSNDYDHPEPSYGICSPCRHHKHQQFTHEAGYEAYEEPLMQNVDGGEPMLNAQFIPPSAAKGRSTATLEQIGMQGTLEVATSATEAGYGQQVGIAPEAFHDIEGFQASLLLVQSNFRLTELFARLPLRLDILGMPMAAASRNAIMRAIKPHSLTC